MADVNPYEAPQMQDYAPAPVAPPGSPFAPGYQIGLWRDGSVLVMHKRAVLPDRCVKSNQPAGGRRLRRKLSWHHPAIALAILAGVLIYIILAVSVLNL